MSWASWASAGGASLTGWGRGAAAEDAGAAADEPPGVTVAGVVEGEPDEPGGADPDGLVVVEVGRAGAVVAVVETVGETVVDVVDGVAFDIGAVVVEPSTAPAAANGSAAATQSEPAIAAAATTEMDRQRIDGLRRRGSG
jgi:hypothetical protein